MKRLIETIRNIFKIEELRKRILFTILIILVYRFGSFVVIPGIDPNQLSIIQRSSEGGLLGLLNMFSGGAFGNASIFALGIMPYITASIIIQLLGMAVPYFQRLQKEGESGRKKLNQIMRYLTVIIVFIQAPGYIRNVIEQFRMAGAVTAVTPFDGSAPGVFFWVSSVVLLTAGTLFIMWLGYHCPSAWCFRGRMCSTFQPRWNRPAGSCHRVDCAVLRDGGHYRPRPRHA